MQIILLSLKSFLFEFIGDFIYWPIWWYTIGFKDRLIFAWRQIKETWRVLTIGLWLAHLFSPIYGDRSFLGRLISLPVRLMVLIWKLFWFIVWLAIILAVIALWIFSPPFAIYMIRLHYQ